MMDEAVFRAASSTSLASAAAAAAAADDGDDDGDGNGNGNDASGRWMTGILDQLVSALPFLSLFSLDIVIVTVMD